MRKLPRRGPIVVAVAALLVLGIGSTPAHAAASDPSADDPSILIIGGDEVESVADLRGEVSIQAGGRHRCTGNLITRQWVLTASHCTVLDDPTAQVRAGSLDYTTGGELVGVSQVERHPNYDWYKVAHDQALVKLDRPVRARPIPMSLKSGKDGTLARIRGWGRTCQDEGRPECGLPAQRLQELGMVVNSSLCDWGLAPDGTPGFDPKTGTCVVSADGEPKQACHGDSGGPLQRKLGGTWYLVATMVGDGDSPEIHPNYCSTSPTGGQGSGVMANVAPSFRWIMETLLACDPPVRTAASGVRRHAMWLPPLIPAPYRTHGSFVRSTHTRAQSGRRARIPGLQPVTWCSRSAADRNRRHRPPARWHG